MDLKNPYLNFVEQVAKTFHDGHSIPLGGMTKSITVKTVSSAPKVLVLAPHPDDECVMGPLPLRLLREVGSEVMTLPITLGSNPTRKAEREEELELACEWIGFRLLSIKEGGLERINPDSREKDPVHWQKAVTELRNSLDQIRPDMLVLPNATDWNLTHLGVNLLAKDALLQLDSFSTTLVETEFWGQMQSPNLMVESSIQEVADLVAALSHHRGEVERNPFHLRLPAWMQDNVRRGAEVIGGQGGTAPDFDFATLYRVSRWRDGKFLPAWEGGRMLPCSDNSSQALFSEQS
jgi:LmbE family N-acetylglucosaminyl deacetylase